LQCKPLQRTMGDDSQLSLPVRVATNPSCQRRLEVSRSGNKSSRWSYATASLCTGRPIFRGQKTRELCTSGSDLHQARHSMIAEGCPRLTPHITNKQLGGATPPHNSGLHKPDGCLLYNIQLCRHLTSEAHGLTVRLDDIFDMRRIAPSHRSHDRDTSATTGG
jgi:hypothetical protein